MAGDVDLRSLGMNEASIANDGTRNHATTLFTFLKEFTELRMKTVRMVDQYEQILWLADIPREPECDCIAWHQDGAEEREEIWLEIRKPRLQPPPAPNPKLKEWIVAGQIEDSALEMPQLRKEISIRIENFVEDGEISEPYEKHLISDHPEIEETWARYVKDKWWPWAESDRRLKAVQIVYNDLFSIYQRQQRLGEQYEVVLGLGLLTWRTPDTQDIKRHLLIAQINITFDAVRGVIKIGPAGEGAQLTLEQDMIDPKFRPPTVTLQALTKQISEIGDELWHGEQLKNILTSWAHAVSAQATFDEDLKPATQISIHPRIHLAPAVLLRKRTERSFVKSYMEILDQLNNGFPIPLGVQSFVRSNIEMEADLRIDGNRNELASGNEIYFPLESNEAQRQIIERLSNYPGVLVQGPPGTGKSHTIVNLIAHLLATGQRILVTSHTDRALDVLKRYIRDKAPEIAPLAIVLLGNDREGLQAMEDSVQGITQRHNLWDGRKNKQEIEVLESLLDAARRDEALILRDLRAIREAETYEHSLRFNRYQGTLAQIAGQLRTEASDYEWLVDRPNENKEPPLSCLELAELVRLLCDEDVTQAALRNWRLTDLTKLVQPQEFERLVASEEKFNLALEEVQITRLHLAYQPIKAGSSEQTQRLAEILRQFLQKLTKIFHSTYEWAPSAGRQILDGRARVWLELAETTKVHLDAVKEHIRWADETTVFGLNERNHDVVRADARDLVQHLEQGGGWGFGPFISAPVKRAAYLRDQVRVDGHACDNVNTLRQLLKWFDIENHLKQIQRHWKPYANIAEGSFTTQTQQFYELNTILASVLQLRQDVEQLQTLIRKFAGVDEPIWHDFDSIRAFYAVVEMVELESISRETTRLLHESANDLKLYGRFSGADPEFGNLLKAVQERDKAAYKLTWDTIGSHIVACQNLERRRALEMALKSNAPHLMGALVKTSDDSAWERRIERFYAAWDWARATGWIKRLCDPDQEQQLRLQLDEKRRQVREHLRKIAAKKAWGHCFERMTEHERQHLVAWSKAMRNLGKGHGKYAQIHRRNASEHMTECRGAIPAWVMPLYRVAETIRPGKDLFDVVIVDEASQSGPEALLLSYLAKKLVVVGDDKQISPNFVGLDREDVNQLRARHIAALPHSDQYGVDNSFFDLAEIRYPGRIRLQEHFRCMPEIIQFSNDLCYSSEPLIPLKQYGASRLTPVIVARYISDGYQKGATSRVMNPPEAEAVANEIVRCCSDAAYRDKTIGVISLLGNYQAREIERLLLKKLGPEEIEKRQIVCGDAYDFQGDERDIIFLSMVSAPNERFATLTSTMYERRFNVAVSRAREQLFLFHSVTLNDLNPQCLRYRLLEYCQNPKRDVQEVAGIVIEELHHLAQTANRGRISAPIPFDSWFEVDVCLRIAERGYRVIPQYEVAGYHIDLVVEGMERRLAIECDGDFWHGPDRYEQDIARQRMLERCGWQFWRVRGSAFALNPDAAMQPLWEMLKRLGI